MKVGILGCGTIGGGVLELLDKLDGVEVVKVFDMPSKKEFLKDRYASNVDQICLDSQIDVVIEAMGGDKFPYECIKKSLLNGKNIVTSNKEVVSKHIEEFYKIAKEKNVLFMCEASVGGGIPLICSLINTTLHDKVERIYGIINGTTNYILTSMNKDGLSLEDALGLARELGFAEYDATADLEGLDMVRKICILSSIAYGGLVSYQNIYNYGISKITKEILRDIKLLGYALKFVAESRLIDGKVYASVEPTLLKTDSPLSAVSYEFNAVYYDACNNGKLGFYGKGAGRYPTASAMVEDVVRIKNGNCKYYFTNNINYKVENFKDISKYYVYDNGKGKILDKLDNENHEFIARIFEE